MKYIAVSEQQNLEVKDTEKPTIFPHQCLIKVKAIGVNRADILQRQGKYPAPKGESTILGLEVAGVIDAVGAEITDRKIGDDVFGLVAGGGYAEYVAVNSDHLMAKPQDLSFTEAAGIAEVFLTAYQSLFYLGKLKAKQKVLIHAGASGVGTAAIQMAKQYDAYVVVTVGSDTKADACLSLGADVAINYHQSSIHEWQKQHLPDGFDVIIDVVAGDTVNTNIAMAALDCTIVILAMLGGRYCQQVDVAKMLQKRVNIIASTLRNRSDEYKKLLTQDFTRDFLSKFQDKSIKPIIFSTLPWHNANDAHQLITSNQTIGKVILTLPS